MKISRPRNTGILAILALTLFSHIALSASEVVEKLPAIDFPFKNGDRVAWVGSSSTRIGIWCKTLEFLLRTRHPELKMTFARQTTGGGTFLTGTEQLSTWLEETKPTLVLFNYGANDAAAGAAGLAKFEDNMRKCVEEAMNTGARVLLVTPQSADVRKTKAGGAEKRKLYAETMIEYCKQKGWTILDTHHALEALQLSAQQDYPAYTINKDVIHLNDAAYVAWGYFLYQRMDVARESYAEISADGKLVSMNHCKINDIKVKDGSITFTRTDQFFPFMPPIPLPPRKYVPLESFSLYMLRIAGLPAGTYRILCDELPVGTCTASDLAAGVNMNTLLLNSKEVAPWGSLAAEIWAGVSTEKIGSTTFKFEVRKEN